MSPFDVVCTKHMWGCIPMQSVIPKGHLGHFQCMSRRERKDQVTLP